MRRNHTDTPDREPVGRLLGKLEDLIADMEELQVDLSDSVEYYMDETDDMFTEAGLYLDEAARDAWSNRMLFRELNAGRKEIISLLALLEDNGICPPEGKHLSRRRLDPALYPQDPDSPFYIQDPDERFGSLLAGQLAELRVFEEETPMTTGEREALRDHIVSRTGFDPDAPEEWARFLLDLRSGDCIPVIEGR